MSERLTLKRERQSAPVASASQLPVARVIVDTGLAHLDEPYDYLVTAAQDASAQPGVRVRVRFSGRLVDGWIIERRSSSDFVGKLKPISSVVSPEVILTPQLLRLCADVADHFAGSLWDVIRTAIPKRQARIESQPSEMTTRVWSQVALPDKYPRLVKFFEHSRSPESATQTPRAIWSLSPGDSHYEVLARTIGFAAQRGGVLVVVPDERDLKLLSEAMGDQEGICILRAGLSPAERYRRYLRLSRGVDRVCIGTRSASFAPVKDLALAIIWDDGDESHFEPRTPGWNSRDVLAIRSHTERVPLLVAAFTISVDSARLLSTQWAQPIAATTRANVTATEDASRIWKMIKTESEKGPVLISVGRVGYRPVLQCRKCASPALCECGGRISQSRSSSPACALCGALHETYECKACGSTGYRAPVVGIERTVEEFGKAFPQRVIRHSTGERPLLRVPNKPMIVISTQGVEPQVEGGYAGVAILDAHVSLYRANLRADEESRRRWFNTAALARTEAPVMIDAEGAHPSIQALIKWSPESAASREFEERSTLHLYPAWEVASIDFADLDPSMGEGLSALGEVLGPIEHEGGWRYIVRNESGLAAGLHQWLKSRSARKNSPVRARMNPFDL